MSATTIPTTPDKPNVVSVIVQQADSNFLYITGMTGFADTRLALNVTIAVFGLFLAGVCICRMNALSPKFHKLKVRLHYLLVFVGALCVSLAPWFFPRYQRTGTLIFVLTVLISMLLSTTEWRRGPPESARTDSELSKLQKELPYDDHACPSYLVCYFASLRRRFQYGWTLVRHFWRGTH